MKPEYKNIDDYIKTFPDHIQAILETLRQTIHQAAPEATEVISYNMPAFKQNSILVYFAAYKNHIGFYPTPSGIEAFKEELADYKWSRGAVQFPLDKPLPLNLVKKIVAFRVQEQVNKI